MSEHQRIAEARIQCPFVSALGSDPVRAMFSESCSCLDRHPYPERNAVQ